MEWTHDIPKGADSTHGRRGHTANLTGTERAHVQFPYSSLSAASQNRTGEKT